MPSVFIPQYQKRGFPVPTSKQAKKHTYISVIIVERFDFNKAEIKSYNRIFFLLVSYKKTMFSLVCQIFKTILIKKNISRVMFAKVRTGKNNSTKPSPKESQDHF